VGPAPGEQDDGLEEAGLAGRVGTPQELGPGAEGGIERLVAADLAQAQEVEQDGRRGTVRLERGGWPASYEVVLTGITTWT
jgi:hypothetical protein